MAASTVPTHRRPPAIYRAARAFRGLGILAVVLLLVYAGTVAYSAFEVARSSPQSRGFSESIATNGTIEIAGAFTITNSGIYPIQSLELTARVANDTGFFLGKLGVGPTDLAAGDTGVYPVALYIPISTTGPVSSLLTTDQYLELNAWGNATYAYLFPISLSLNETRSWGAPFEAFRVSVGAPMMGGGGTVTVPVTISFSNHAAVPDEGTLAFVVESSNSDDCGSGSFSLDVPSGALFDQTDDTTLAAGCSPLGGQVLATYTNGGAPIALPPEAIP